MYEILFRSSVVKNTFVPNWLSRCLIGCCHSWWRDQYVSVSRGGTPCKNRKISEFFSLCGTNDITWNSLTCPLGDSRVRCQSSLYRGSDIAYVCTYSRWLEYFFLFFSQHTTVLKIAVIMNLPFPLVSISFIRLFLFVWSVSQCERCKRWFVRTVIRSWASLARCEGKGVQRYT